MGDLTLIECCNAALVRCLFAKETAIVNNTDSDVQIMPELANMVVAELLVENWPPLVRTGIIDVSAPDVSGGLQWTIAGDAHHLVSDTAFSSSGIRELILPTSAYEWGARSVRTSSGTLQYAFRLFGRQLTAVDRAPAEDVRYEYISNRIILKSSSSSVARVDQVASDFVTRFTDDGDLFQFDSELLIKGIHWRFGQVKRLEGWQETLAEYQQYKRDIKGHEQMATTVRLGEGVDRGLSAPITEQELGY